ncbi:16S rRNA (guanine(527)-N(7))-methyltransferase RsmG [uncultured Sphingomonas sp.]|uniref:16S rRNA (guanine(527)-N(7))-methyltransferase RsmG n=1 Tax=uncultured Sphingomonas sp. TaxID=158754 RepID=UPI0035CCA0F2
MTEQEAVNWVGARYDDDVVNRLQGFVSLVSGESARQNLVARSTIDRIWLRHIVDSLQLHPLGTGNKWLDIGSGAGFPGMALAIAHPDITYLLIEPRRKRADFLIIVATSLALKNVKVICARIEKIAEPMTTITARAVAAIDHVFRDSIRCADNHTMWVLPKGRSAEEEVAHARQRWHGVFHVEQSITDPTSQIVIASKVRLHERHRDR